jgi:hypothetical protein
MHHRYDQFRKNASHAQQMADRAPSAVDKEAWLRVAQGWLSLIRKPNPTAEQRFDDQVQSDGTHQADSDQRH